MSVPPRAEVRFSDRDAPSPEFIADMRARFPVEREMDALLTRKLERRTSPPYSRISMAELEDCLRRMFADVGVESYTISDTRWFTGGVSKIQLGFTLEWNRDGQPRRDRMVVRMDPAEGSNTTSRLREYELLRAFEGIIPVPHAYWVDQEARWFPEPALVYAFAEGVTKPSLTTTGQVTGLGTNFGPELRAKLAPQFIAHLAAIHTFDFSPTAFESMEPPPLDSTQNALWQVNRARRIWEEDRGEDHVLMNVAANWLTDNLPPLDHASIVHGDFRSGNFLFDEASGEITAWLDWERAHIGDRHRDLAWMTEPAMGHYSEDGLTYYVCGLVPEEEFYERYTEASGLEVDPERLAFYRILNSFQIIASVTATGYRVARLGKSHQDPLLTRVKGLAPVVTGELAHLLKERL